MFKLALVLCILSFTFGSFAEDFMISPYPGEELYVANSPSAEYAHKKASGPEIVCDLLIVRPVLAVFTGLGIAAYGVTLPFTVVGGNVDRATKKLVTDPIHNLFGYPLGSYFSKDTQKIVNPDGSIIVHHNGNRYLFD